MQLPGSLWGITAYFNSDGLSVRYQNYLKFRANSKRQGLKLIAVELEFDDSPFELKPGDADILIQVRGGENNFIWQKEALMNIALQKLPVDCDKLVWIDCDVILKNDNWVNETGRLLQEYKVVQPYSWAAYLPQGQVDADPMKMPLGFGEGRQVYSMAYRVVECGPEVIEHYFLKNGHVGFAWACRRDIIQDLTFLDTGIFHQGDSLMAFSFYGFQGYFKWVVNSYLPPESLAWADRAAKLIKGEVSYCPGVLMHLWHGDFGTRIYDAENQDHLFGSLKESGFDFNKDLKKNKDGLWEWVGTSGGDFRHELKRFYQRKHPTLKMQEV